MRLEELQLRNFRQFYGDQSMVFATDAERNVTVIHGYNGAGKTALLNAFVWCLYGLTTDDLEAPDRLVNERAISDATAGQEVPVRVRLRYGYGGSIFLAERRSAAVRDLAGTVRQTKGELTLFQIAEGGQQTRVEGGQVYIDRQLPQNLYPFFFFNGERVERMASPEAYDEVEGGVKTLLDVEIYERSMRHLRDAVSTALSTELKEHSGTAEMKDAVDREADLKQQQATAHDTCKTLRGNVDATEAEIEKLELAQTANREVAEFARQRKEARASLERVESEIARIQSDCARNLSKNGYLAFADSVFLKADQLVANARKRGDLPAKVKPQFVDDLIRERKCVCGRAIGDHEESVLLEWRKTTGLAELEEAISHSSAAIGGLRERRRTYFEEIDLLHKRTGELHSERRALLDQLEEISRRIGDRSNGEEPEALEQARQTAVRKRDDYRFELRQEEQHLSQLEAKLHEVEKEIAAQESANERSAVIQRQKIAVNRIADALERLYEIQKDDVRTALSDLVSQTWADAAVKDYKASVSSDFRLVLTKTVRGVEQTVHGASTGEKQVLALAFVGSLVKKARMNLEDNPNEQGHVGGNYPLVMDSPFGALEDDYRRKVAEWVPRLASQVIVMVSKTQWRNEVEAVLSPKIGRRYVLELHTPKSSKEGTITVEDREYAYVVTSADQFEKTLLRAVEQ